MHTKDCRGEIRSSFIAENWTAPAISLRIMELAKDGLLNVADAAKRLQISEAEVEAML